MAEGSEKGYDRAMQLAFTKTAGRVVATVLLAGLATLGCDKHESDRAAAAGSTTPTVASDELGALCQRMCDKDVTCAGETARQAAKAAGLDAVADDAAAKAIEKVKQGLATCKADCVTTAKQGAAAGQAQTKAIERCLAVTDCGEYSACVGKIATGGPPGER